MWAQLIVEMELTGMAGQLASHCSLHSLDLKKCVLYLKPSLHHLLFDHVKEKICIALNKHFGTTTMELEILLKEPEWHTPAELMTQDRNAKHHDG